MAENFYSQSLSSLSSWGRGLNPDEVIRYRLRFFDQVGHETTYASSGNKHFFTK